MSQKIVSIAEFDDFTNFLEKMEHRFWVFRGHGRINWRIESSLVRFFRSHRGNIKRINYSPREEDAITKFRSSAHLHLAHVPAEDDKLSWLAIMQHFDAPTRLIDFTHSPFVALFFALYIRA
jgi:hypothetical protein